MKTHPRTSVFLNLSNIFRLLSPLLKPLVISPLIALCIAGCGGRDANPVMVQQYGDEKMSCKAIKGNLDFIESEIKRLMPKSSKAGKNTLLGVAGAFLIVPWFFMELSNAEQVEINALRHRYNNLVLIAGDKNCGFDKTQIADFTEPKKETPKPGQALTRRSSKKKESIPEAANSPETTQESAMPEDILKQETKISPSPQQESASETSLKSVGTGFIINSNGFLVTNYHVIKDAKKVNIRTLSGTEIKAEIVTKDVSNDLAVLKLDLIPSGIESNMFLGDSSKMKSGDKVFTIGYPLSNILGKQPRYTEGVINSIYGTQDDPRLFQVSVQIQPGNSGGPLFNESGEVIGIAVSSLDAKNVLEITGTLPQNVNFAIKSVYLKTVLAMLPDLGSTLVLPTNVVVKENQAANFAEKYKNNIVLVEAEY